MALTSRAVICDGCGEMLDYDEWDIDKIEELAKEDGWTVEGWIEHYCPECAENGGGSDDV